jgi:hypothetical protein
VERRDSSRVETGRTLTQKRGYQGQEVHTGDETIPNGDNGQPTRPNYFEALLYALVAFGFGVVMTVMPNIAPDPMGWSLRNAICAEHPALDWVLSLIWGRTAGVGLCLIAVIIGAWAFSNYVRTRNDTGP